MRYVLKQTWEIVGIEEKVRVIVVFVTVTKVITSRKLGDSFPVSALLVLMSKFLIKIRYILESMYKDISLCKNGGNFSFLSV